MGLYARNDHPNAVVRGLRRLYNPIGFKKGYNALLWFIFGGAMFGFVLARLMYFDINGIFKNGAAPGEWFYYQHMHYRVIVALHIYCVVPAGILAVMQFTPWIRYNALVLHRVCGYIAITLLVTACVTAMLMCRHSFNGTLATQSWVGTLAIGVCSSLALAYYNIKRLQIDQHRKWMLRAWFWAGCIVTLRFVMLSSAAVLTALGSFWLAMDCQKIAYTSGARTMESYAACRDDPEGFAAVHVDFNGNAVEVAASLNISFGMAGWIALVLHVLGLEIYLAFTEAETERLRQVSYERQMERGMSHPGSAGVMADRYGDAAPWSPVDKRHGLGEQLVEPTSDSDIPMDGPAKIRTTNL